MSDFPPIIKALAIVPKIFAIPSIMGSTFIFQEVMRSKKKRGETYQRLMAAMSFCDIIGSIGAFLGTWPIPRGTPGVYMAVGTTQTCTAAGFFNQLVGPMTPMYNGALGIYYICKIRYNWPARRVKQVEMICHAVIVSIGVCTSIAGIPLNLYNNADNWVCWISEQPLGCYDTYRYGEEANCERGNNAWIYQWAWFYSLGWASFLVMTGSLAIVYQSVRRVEVSIDSYDMTGGRRRENSNAVFWQGVLYCIAFMMTWIFTTLSRVIFLTTGRIFFWLLFLLATFWPLQGFWNCLIYLRPRYLKFKKKYPNASYYDTIRSVLNPNAKARSPEAMNKSTKYVSSMHSFRSRYLRRSRGESQEDVSGMMSFKSKFTTSQPHSLDGGYSSDDGRSAGGGFPSDDGMRPHYLSSVTGDAPAVHSLPPPNDDKDAFHNYDDDDDDNNRGETSCFADEFTGTGNNADAESTDIIHDDEDNDGDAPPGSNGGDNNPSVIMPNLASEELSLEVDGSADPDAWLVAEIPVDSPGGDYGGDEPLNNQPAAGREEEKEEEKEIIHNELEQKESLEVVGGDVNQHVAVISEDGEHSTTIPNQSEHHQNQIELNEEQQDGEHLTLPNQSDHENPIIGDNDNNEEQARGGMHEEFQQEESVEIVGDQDPQSWHVAPEDSTPSVPVPNNNQAEQEDHTGDHVGGDDDDDDDDNKEEGGTQEEFHREESVEVVSNMLHVAEDVKPSSTIIMPNQADEDVNHTQDHDEDEDGEGIREVWQQEESVEIRVSSKGDQNAWHMAEIPED